MRKHRQVYAINKKARQFCPVPVILLAGGTGLVGTAVIQAVMQDHRVDGLVVLARRPLPVQLEKLEQWIAANGLLDGLRNAPIDAVICCLGTTMKNVGGDREQFVHVDRDLVVGLANWAKDHGARCFAVVSAVGADPGSRVFYNRVKGEMERDVEAVGFDALHIFHPSILTGPRAELRLGERIGIAAMTLFAPLLPAAYTPMPHDTLARALVNAALTGQPGVHRHTYRAIVELSRVRS